MFKRLLVKNQDVLLSELSQEIPANGIITVGNDPSATIELNNDSIATEQFVIVCEPEQLTLMCRVDGTIINGKTMPNGSIHNLQIADVITLGGYSLMLEDDELASIEEAKDYQPKTQYSAPDSLEAVENISNPEERIERSLTDVLAGLRAEEKFYFQIEDLNRENCRFYVENEEMWLGWAMDGSCLLAAEESKIDVQRAQIRKDWSGIVLNPLEIGSIKLNNKILTDQCRLKNDDQILLKLKDSIKQFSETIIKFHEPTALLVLDSILPKELPPPISFDNDKNLKNDVSLGEEENLLTGQIPSGAKKYEKRMIFGHFTVTEIIIMTIGTLITAAIIFLILELY